MPAWRADLHVHTVLSACAETEMIPPLIVARCREQGLGLVGVVDHNSAGNAQATIEAAAGAGVVVKPGLEVETKETVHLLCLFDTVEQALALQGLVHAHLPVLHFAGGSGALGEQFLVDREGAFVGYDEQCLFGATDLTAEEAAEAAHEAGGLVLAAHVDRRAHGLLGVLGFAPPGLALDGLECGPGSLTAGRVASSDAHRLSEIGSRYTVFEMDGTTVADLREALAGGRYRTGLAI